jgi:membrane-bound ClpP family serine protease
MFIALGLALSEVGVLFALRPVSVSGLLLFVGSVAGILAESGYVTRSTRSIGAQGIALLVIGSVLILRNQTGMTIRGQSIVIAGVLCFVLLLLRIGYHRLRFGNTNRASDASESSSD